MIMPSPPKAGAAEAEPVDGAILATLHQLDDDGPPIIFTELVNLFFESTPNLISLASGAIDDPMQLRTLAHTLKGSCSNFGAYRMETLCVELEELAGQGHDEHVRALIEAIEAEFFRVKEALEFHCG